MDDVTPGNNYGINPCTICDIKLAITHYNVSTDGKTTFKSMIILTNSIPNVCKSCNFFVCDDCKIQFESTCCCGGNLITYKEFCNLFT